MPREPLRNFRCSDAIWLRAKNKAARRGETLADVLRRALVEYAQPNATPRRHPLRRAEDQKKESA